MLRILKSANAASQRVNYSAISASAGAGLQPATRRVGPNDAKTVQELIDAFNIMKFNQPGGPRKFDSASFGNILELFTKKQAWVETEEVFQHMKFAGIAQDYKARFARLKMLVALKKWFEIASIAKEWKSASILPTVSQNEIFLQAAAKTADFPMMEELLAEIEDPHLISRIACAQAYITAGKDAGLTRLNVPRNALFEIFYKLGDLNKVTEIQDSQPIEGKEFDKKIASGAILALAYAGKLDEMEAAWKLYPDEVPLVAKREIARAYRLWGEDGRAMQLEKQFERGEVKSQDKEKSIKADE